eukprot:TRINITY_DN75881_c0_g1_i1.p2 TRINITY_DN75881_c0_g1~~TRINITY_DN75881_c0_g1_i1.p2  ORF type:complete len:156 (+),score=23.14 TRINITY_DN75881_c0_g1_i1:33-470(+)
MPSLYHKQGAGIFFKNGWGAPTHKTAMADMFLVSSWKWYSPFPRWGSPEGYTRKRDDYRDDYDMMKPYINSYRAITERRDQIGSGMNSAFFCNIQGFTQVSRRHGGTHPRRQDTMRGRTAGVKGSRHGHKFGNPWQRTGAVGRMS